MNWKDSRILRFPGDPAVGQQPFSDSKRKSRRHGALQELNRRIVNWRKAEYTCCSNMRRALHEPGGRGVQAILMAGQGYEDADRQAPLYCVRQKKC